MKRPKQNNFFLFCLYYRREKESVLSLLSPLSSSSFSVILVFSSKAFSRFLNSIVMEETRTLFSSRQYNFRVKEKSATSYSLSLYSESLLACLESLTWKCLLFVVKKEKNNSCIRYVYISTVTLQRKRNHRENSRVQEKGERSFFFRV